MSSPLDQLAEQGQSIWLDYISRELVTSGELERLIDSSRVTGLTSNPTIFEKAIATGTDYDRHIRELVADGITDPNEVFLGLAISDIRRATDILRPTYERTEGQDGFASLEVLPSLAHDTETTVATARSFWQRVDRPNLMVKIPATREGIPAIRRAIGEGININVTLIFSLRAYRQVIDAYLDGLRERQGSGQSLRVHSVASFFVSRVDTAVDRLIDRRVQESGGAEVGSLRGKAAIANARVAYELFEQVFLGEPFEDLRAAGAHVQRPLWASTSAKDPRYRDVVYAEALVGPHSVDTMPPSTIEAFRDHGVVEGPTARTDHPGAHRVIADLARGGIDMESVTATLLEEGVASFTASYDTLIRVIAEKIDSLHGGCARRQQRELGADSERVDRAVADAAGVAARIWRRDPDLWKPGDASHAAVITNRLGWLDVIDLMRQRLPEHLGLAAEVRDEGCRDVVLMGMGGSSLGPEVLRASYGSAAGHPTLHVLDTTDPAAIASLTRRLDIERTLFVVASKSGTTLETLCHLDHFWEMVRTSGATDPGRRFVAITDPGSPLAEIAQERAFRHLFLNPADIGGRYSALSHVGLVPAALLGIDVEALLSRAADMRIACAAGLPPDLNCGVLLGSVLAEEARAGRNKVTLLAAPGVSEFGLWAEQLIAESTGKEGRGLVPVSLEPAGSPESYGPDRLFVEIRLAGNGSPAADALRRAGHPVMSIELRDLHDLAAEFFRWEFATAVAGAALGIDPFDEPNVQESKDNTRRVLGLAPPGDGHRRDGLEAVEAEPGATLRRLLDQFRPGDYVALMAYLTPDEPTTAALQGLRAVIRERHRAATTLGFGPRFLHSTGQLHKGGPDTGVFVQLTADDREDVPIPGREYTFSGLKRAQAEGDLQSLTAHGRRVARIDLGDDPPAAVRRLAADLRSTAVVVA